MLAATRLIVFLRGQDFRSFGVEIRLSLPSAYPYSLMGPEGGVYWVYRPKHLTDSRVVLAGLSLMMAPLHSFDDTTKSRRWQKIYEAVDRLEYGNIRCST
jgi:hypothetical protein